MLLSEWGRRRASRSCSPADSTWYRMKMLDSSVPRSLQKSISSSWAASRSRDWLPSTHRSWLPGIQLASRAVCLALNLVFPSLISHGGLTITIITLKKQSFSEYFSLKQWNSKVIAPDQWELLGKTIAMNGQDTTPASDVNAGIDKSWYIFYKVVPPANYKWIYKPHYLWLVPPQTIVIGLRNQLSYHESAIIPMKNPHFPMVSIPVSLTNRGTTLAIPKLFSTTSYANKL